MRRPPVVSASTASAELRERERTKVAAVTAAVDDAVRQRGIDPATARLVAPPGAVAFQNAFDRWVDTSGDFGTCLDEVAKAVRAVVR